MILATRNHNDNTRMNRTERTRKQKWEEKQFYATNKQHFSRENVDAAKKWKPQGRFAFSPNGSTKRCNKEYPYQIQKTQQTADVDCVVIETKPSIAYWANIANWHRKNIRLDPRDEMDDPLRTLQEIKI